MLPSNFCTYRAQLFHHFAVFDNIAQQKTLQVFELPEYVPMSAEVDVKCSVLESTHLEERKSTEAEMMMLTYLPSRRKKKWRPPPRRGIYQIIFYFFFFLTPRKRGPTKN